MKLLKEARSLGERRMKLFEETQERTKVVGWLTVIKLKEKGVWERGGGGGSGQMGWHLSGYMWACYGIWPKVKYYGLIIQACIKPWTSLGLVCSISSLMFTSLLMNIFFCPAWLINQLGSACLEINKHGQAFYRTKPELFMTARFICK